MVIKFQELLNKCPNQWQRNSLIDDYGLKVKLFDDNGCRLTTTMFVVILNVTDDSDMKLDRLRLIMIWYDIWYW